MRRSYICIRDCYYGPPGLRKLFKVGDMLPENWEPNKHFLKGAAVPPEEVDGPARVPGDDPRSTSRIIRDLRLIHRIDMTGKTRKEVFEAWIRAEEKKDEGIDPEPVKTEGEADTDGPKDPLNGKRFSDMTPDEINNAKRDAIVDAINKRFKLDMAHGGKSKAELVQLGIDKESRQTGANAPH